jgi:hypothetical protein
MVTADVASQLGDQITRVALPLVAVVALDASAFEVGVLVALGRLAFSAAVLARIGTPEPASAAPRRERRIRDGVAFVLADQGLRAILLMASTGNLAFGAWYAIQPVFLLRDLRLDAAAYGVLLGMAAAGGVAGSALSARFAGAFGSARYLLVAVVAAGLCFLLVPLTGPDRASRRSSSARSGRASASPAPGSPR